MTEQVFTLSAEGARRHPPSPARLEKDVQGVFEHNLESLLSLRFLASEFTTPCQTMRMDTIALDEGCCPVIVEYKLDSDSSVMNQGLYYLNWMLSNKSVIQVLVQEVAGKETADKIDWSGARVVIIAGAYAKYDLYAIEQVQANIDLYTYSIYQQGIMILKHVAGQRRPDYRSTTQARPQKTKLSFQDAYRLAPKVVRDRIDRFSLAVADLASDIVISDILEHRVIAVPMASPPEIARMHLTEGVYPKFRLEIYGAADDFDLGPKIRTKKTRTGFEFSVTDDEYFDLAIEVIRQIYARSSGSW